MDILPLPTIQLGDDRHGATNILGSTRLICFMFQATSHHTFDVPDRGILCEEFSLKTRRKQTSLAVRAVRIPCHKVPDLALELECNADSDHHSR